MEIAISVVTKLIVGFIGLLIVVRVIGKKNLSQISPYDLVYTLVLGGILEESIYDDNVSIFHLILGLVLWGFLIWVIERIANTHDQLNKTMKGEPDVLVYNGQVTFDNKDYGHPMELEQMRALMRTANCYSLRNVKHMILETGGQINVIKYDEDDNELSIMLVDEGTVEEEVLESYNKSTDWLKNELAELGYSNLDNIFYAEWISEEDFYVISYDDIDRRDLLIDG